MTKIGINALCYSPKRAGISNYIYNLIQQYRKNNKNDKIIIFLPLSAKEQIFPSENIQPIFLPIPHLFFRIVFEQFLLPLLFIFYRLNILHSMGNVAPLLLFKKNVVTIHDIYFLHDKKRFGVLKQLYLQIFVKLSAILSKSIISVSKSTANDIIHFYKVSETKIRVIYSGVQNYESNNNQPIDLKSKFKIKEKFFLFVGTIEPGKNLKGLIEGFSYLTDKDDCSLVIVGKSGWGNKELENIITVNHLHDQIKFTGYVTDNELSELYKRALSLVLPSFHEGFGLPIIEAMSQGCPVCCSNTSCLPEIAGDAALFFDPYDSKSIGNALNEILNKKHRNMLIKKGYENIKRFSWSECAEKTYLNLI